MNVIAAALPQRIAAVPYNRQSLPLLDALPILNHKRPARQMRIMTELPVAVVDRYVIAKRPMLVVLTKPQIVSVHNPGLHCHDATPGPWRDIVSVKRISPMRESSIRPLRNH